MVEVTNGKASGKPGGKAGDKACPICGKPNVERYRPFCSRRCADVDLNRWLSGAYVVPGAASEQDDDAPPRSDDVPQ